MIGSGNIELQHWGGLSWVGQTYKYTKLLTLPKVQAEKGTDLAGTGYEHIKYKKQQYIVDIYINRNSTEYSSSFSVYINHLFDFYASNRKRLVIDSGTPFEVLGTDSDVLNLEYMEFSDTLATITLTFEDKVRKNTSWS